MICINTATPGPPCTPGGLVDNHSHQKLCDERGKKAIDLEGVSVGDILENRSHLSLVVGLMYIVS